MTALAGETVDRTDRRTPMFCRVCGTRLVPNGSVTGYDPFTGEALSENHLNCPNPTVTSKLGVKSVTKHPSWTEYDGVWSEV